MDLRLGTCGWSFADWKDTFYPPGTKNELAYYASQFDAVEIDSTYYRIPSAKSVDAWRERTPRGFLFCPKLPGEITHEKLLEGADEQVATFTGVISRLDQNSGRSWFSFIPVSPMTSCRSWRHSCRICRRHSGTRWSFGTGPGWISPMRCSCYVP